MGRRSDHSRAELERLIIAEGHAHMAENGFARFSAREVAKRIGYSIGTLYNVFDNYDRLILAINTYSFQLWTDHLNARLDGVEGDRIRALVEGYFSFARENTHIWMAIYDHHLPPDVEMPEEFALQRGELTGIVVREVAVVLPDHAKDRATTLARSLIATVHGHCTFALNGTFALMGETEPMETALARVRESIAAAQRDSRIRTD